MLKKYNDLPQSLNDLATKTVDAIFQVYKNLGPGYPERIYEAALSHELGQRDITFDKQKIIKVVYPPNILLDPDYRLDLVIEDQIILELKCVETLLPVHEAQLLSYMRMAQMELGFLVNFNVPLIKQGIKRHCIKNLRSSDSSLQNKEVC